MIPLCFGILWPPPRVNICHALLPCVHPSLSSPTLYHISRLTPATTSPSFRSTPPSTRSVNIDLGPAQDKMLITGLHSICDVHCTQCRTYLGWKYVGARHCLSPLLYLFSSTRSPPSLCNFFPRYSHLFSCALTSNPRSAPTSRSKNTSRARLVVSEAHDIQLIGAFPLAFRL